jgi:hypothetical protein
MSGHDGMPEDGIPHETLAALAGRWGRRDIGLASIERLAAAVSAERAAIAAFLDHRGLRREAKLIRGGAHHPILEGDPA